MAAPAGGEWTVRGLESERDLEAFYDHVELCFKEKGTPREYFVRHWENDPWSSMSHIRAAVTPEGQVVGVVRAFCRRAFVGRGRIMPYAGIGEVSTNPAWGRKGIAQALLVDAMDYFAQHPTAAPASDAEAPRVPAMAGLHASEAHMPLYQRSGFTEMPLKRIVLPCERIFAAADGAASGGASLSACSIAELPDATLEGLMALHNKWNSQFFGPLVRDDVRYWKKWVAGEAGHSALAVGPDGAPQGLLSLKRRADGAVWVSDICLAAESGADTAGLRTSFNQLAATCLKAAGIEPSSSLVVPVVAAERLGIAATEGTPDVRRGYMFRCLNSSDAGAALTDLFTSSLPAGAAPDAEVPHVFWQADGF